MMVLRWIKQHSLFVGLLLMFAFTWPIDGGFAAYSRGLINFQIPDALALFVGYGIVIATIVITWLVSGRSGVVALLRRFLIWRVDWKWYAAAIFLPLALMLLAIGLNSLLTRTVPDFSQYFAQQIFGPNINPWVLILPYLLFALLTNGEEIGWRGFALPRLQKRYSPLVASLILGVIWAVWHLPKYFMVGTTLGGGNDISVFFINSVRLLAQAILYTWIYNHTKGSLLLVSLFHASWNAFWLFLPIQSAAPAELIVYWLAAIVVVVIEAPTWLGRKIEALPAQVT